LSFLELLFQPSETLRGLAWNEGYVATTIRAAEVYSIKTKHIMKALSTALLLLIPAFAHTQDLTVSQTFGTGGDILLNLTPGYYEGASEHAITPDGNVLLAGYCYIDGGPNTYHSTFVRINPVCGSLDTSLAGVGYVLRTFEGRTVLRGLAVQPDNAIVGCGMIAPDNGGSGQWPGVFRLKPDGDVDSTFNGTGYHRLTFAGSGGMFYGVFVAPDSTITCVGAGGNKIGAYRFLHDGTLDTTFSADGAAWLDLPSYDTGVGCGLVLPDSSIISMDLMYSGGGNSRVITMAKFHYNGDIDSTFGVNGLATTSIYGSPTTGLPGTRLHAVLQPDGKILVSSIGDGNVNFSMARFLPNGGIDITYGSNGLSLVSDPSVRGEGIVLLADGSTYQFGNNGTNGLILKRDMNGQVDTGFGTNGFFTTPTGDPNGRTLHSGVLLPDGRLIGHGGSHQSLYVTSLNTDAAADALPVISINGNELSSTGTGTFQWFLNGQIITGPTASTFTPTQNGDYTVTMTVSADCEFTSDPYTLLNVGVSELAGSPIHIANNPVSDMLVVLNNGGVVRYEVLGIEGQRISTGQLQAGRNEIDMNGTASGVYLLRTELKGSIATQRIVKQ
jgi:uncharacterized delta-60 repeat protein